jgi:purine-binding chemotaxis protein CheW
MRELLLTSFGGRQYGIWKDAILSIRDLHALHRIPLSPACIAGIMIDDGQTVTLGDLSVCIGFEPSPAIGQGQILLMAEGEKVTGFVVSGELRTQSISSKMLFPLPDFLKTPGFDTCAVHNGISIPIINIAEFYLRAMKAGGKSFVRAPQIHAAQPWDITGTEQLRFFAAAEELYAVPAAGTDDNVVKLGPITPLPNTPQYVQGVTFLNGRLLPVIDLTQRIKRQSGAPESLMLIANIADAVFGFLIDSDEGTSPAGKVSIKPLPLIAQSSWLKNVVVREGELIPLIDLAMVLSTVSGAAGDKPLWQRYATDSRFTDHFFKHDVEVVEFSLLGVRHALPKVEVEDVIAFKPCRMLPDVVPIVIGVAEHNGEIFPVVDLAMMFGRRSLATPEWRMMLVHNGDFRALVITESVSGERRLPFAIQRAVPIHLPHNLMYGCYPDENAVRIILNVEAISVHFEKSLIQKLMPALSQEMRMSPTGVVYTFPGEKAGQTEKVVPGEKVGEQPQPSAIMAPARAEAEPVSEAAPAAELSPAVPEFKQQAEEAVAEFAEWEEADTMAPAIAPEGNQVHEPVAMSKEPPLKILKTSAKKKQPRKVSATETADRRPSEPTSVTASVKSGEPYHSNREVEQLAVLPGHEQRAADKAWKSTIAYGAIVAVLIAVFYFLGSSDKPVSENSMQGTQPAKIEQAMVQPQVKEEAIQVKTKAEHEAQAQAEIEARAKQEANAQQTLVLAPLTEEQTEPPRLADKSRAPLELDIPANKPVDIDVYVVQEGDTLWSISQRFTGSPYNYPRIAGENKIANPDLIFPGQRIRLIK